MQGPDHSTSRAVRRVRVGVQLLLLLALTTVFLVAAPPRAAQACLSDPGRAPNGTWVNLDADTRGETRINVNPCTGYSSCSGSICRTSYRSTIQAWGSCSPSDCDWGRESLQSAGDDWQHATFSRSWKTATVWIRPYVYGGRDFVRVWVHHDYHDGRTDRISDNWFVRE